MWQCLGTGARRDSHTCCGHTVGMLCACGSTRGQELDMTDTHAVCVLCACGSAEGQELGVTHTHAADGQGNSACCCS